MSDVDVHPTPGVAETIAVRRLTRHIGAEITGIDLGRGWDEPAFARIHQALMDHGVVFLRDQTLDIDQQLAFASRFGTPAYSKKLPMYDERHETVSLLENDGSRIAVGARWHTDNTDWREPPMGALLFCEVAPSVGGDTVFASMYAAYEALSPRMQSILDGMRALHDNSLVQKTYGGTGTLRTEGTAVGAPVEHPIVRTHPVTGRKALFVNAVYTRRIVGLSEAESDALLGMVYRHLERPEFQCRFRWQADSLAIWDNRCVQHYAVDDYQELRRMRRVQILGDRPF